MPETAPGAWRNRIACLDESAHVEAPLQKWMAVDEDWEPERGQPHLTLARSKSSPVAPQNRQYEQKSGSREVVVAPPHTYTRRQIEELFERVKRLEALAERVEGRVEATEDVSEDMFIARHNLEPMWRFAQEAAHTIYGSKLVRIEKRLDTDLDTGAPFLAVDIDAAVERAEYTPLQDRFLDMVWGQFEHVNPRAILFSFHSV